MTTIKNTFHNTTARTVKTADQIDAIRERVQYHEANDAERALIRRIDNKLCGIKDCCCGGFTVIS
ncbi:MAG: hypothetical protein P4L67_04510 [Candidatus Pacebacteria bacterium]|nr:hypothetical protein [Candidatus Paceibacterota bacterium]